MVLGQRPQSERKRSSGRSPKSNKNHRGEPRFRASPVRPKHRFDLRSLWIYFDLALLSACIMRFPIRDANVRPESSFASPPRASFARSDPGFPSFLRSVSRRPFSRRSHQISGKGDGHSKFKTNRNATRRRFEADLKTNNHECRDRSSTSYRDVEGCQAPSWRKI
jgi:hypothetical protein